MGALSPMHLIIILVVALLILGPGKLPETGEALGKAVRELRRAMADEPAGVSAATPLDPTVNSGAAEVPTRSSATGRGLGHDA